MIRIFTTAGRTRSNRHHDSFVPPICDRLCLLLVRPSPISLHLTDRHGSKGAKLNNANFTNADLTGADFTGADLAETIFTEAKLVNTQFDAGFEPTLKDA